MSNSTVHHLYNVVLAGCPASVRIVDGSDVMWIDEPAEPAPVDCVNYLAVNTTQTSTGEPIDLSHCLVKLTGNRRLQLVNVSARRSIGHYRRSKHRTPLTSLKLVGSGQYYYNLVCQLAAQIFLKKHTYIKLQQMTTKKQILTYTCSHTKL